MHKGIHGRRRLHRAVACVGLVAGLLVAALLLSTSGPADAQAGGAILVNVRAGGQEAKAEVVVVTAAAEPEQVAKGRSGKAIPVPNGTYDVEITCTELLDHPQQQLRGVTVNGETVEREATFPSGTTTLNIRRGGRLLKNTKLYLMKRGSTEELPGTGKVGVPFKLTPGNYEAEIRLGRGRKKTAHAVTGIQVYDGATRRMTTDLN